MTAILKTDSGVKNSRMFSLPKTGWTTLAIGESALLVKGPVVIKTPNGTHHHVLLNDRATLTGPAQFAIPASAKPTTASVVRSYVVVLQALLLMAFALSAGDFTSTPLAEWGWEQALFGTAAAFFVWLGASAAYLFHKPKFTPIEETLYPTQWADAKDTSATPASAT